MNDKLKEMCQKYAPEFLDFEGLAVLIRFQLVTRGATEDELEGFDNYVNYKLNQPNKDES